MWDIFPAVDPWGDHHKFFVGVSWRFWYFPIHETNPTTKTYILSLLPNTKHRTSHVSKKCDWEGERYIAVSVFHDWIIYHEIGLWEKLHETSRNHGFVHHFYGCFLSIFLLTNTWNLEIAYPAAIIHLDLQMQPLRKDRQNFAERRQDLTPEFLQKATPDFYFPC